MTGRREEDLLAFSEMMTASVKTLLHAIGEDVSREGLKDTPMRVCRFWRDWSTIGLEPPKMTVFEKDGTDEMVVQRGIPFFSVCEHHLLPFFGTVDIGYIPGAKIVGLSKLARVVEFWAHRPQNQERLTRQIASSFTGSELSPVGIGVVIRARHLCMEMRGVRAHGTDTTTSHLEGAIRSQPDARAEFLELTRSSR